MPNFTSTYNFNLPLVRNSIDGNLWGGYLNDNWTALDALLSGSTSLTALSLSSTLSVTGLITATAGVKIPTGQSIKDGNSNELITFTTTASAVNELTLANAATGTNPNITASGGDSNIGVDITTKGTGVVNLRGNSTQSGRLALFEDTDNGTNKLTIAAPASIASDVTFTLPSADGSAGQALITNGSGTLSFANGRVLQVAEVTSTTSDSTTTAIPADNTIPQNTEGKELTTLSFTPVSASSTLLIEFCGHLSNSGSNQGVVALFVDTTADAIGVACGLASSGICYTIKNSIKVASGSTSARTYKLRWGANTGTCYINGNGSTALYGGVMPSYIRVTEIL